MTTCKKVHTWSKMGVQFLIFDFKAGPRVDCPMYLFTKSSFLIKQIIPYLFVFKGHWCRHRKMHCATDWSLNTKLARFWRPKSSSFSNSQWKSQVWIIIIQNSVVWCKKKYNFRKNLASQKIKSMLFIINFFWIRHRVNNFSFPKMSISAFEVFKCD